MKHLKLLVLLMVASMATMSYAQNGTVGGDEVVYGGSVTYASDSTYYAIAPMAEAGYFVSAEQGSDLLVNAFSIPVSVLNLQVMTATLRQGSPFGLLRDPNTPRTIGRMAYNFDTPQAMTDVWLALRADEPGFFTDTLILSSNIIGMPQVGIILQGQVFASDSTQGGDSTFVGEPYLSVSTTQLTLTGANPETWTLASGELTIYSQNIDVLQLQMQTGRNIQMGTADGYFVTSKSYNLNNAVNTIYEELLLNTVSAGQYTDVLIISAPNTNLQPVYVNVSAVIEASQGGDSTAAYVAIEDFPNPLTLHANQGEDMVISIPVTCRNIDSLTVYVTEPFSTVNHHIAGFGTSFARYYSNEISEDGYIYLNLQVGTEQAGQFDGYIYVYANEGYPDYTLTTSITVIGDSTNQGGDSTVTGRYMDVPASGQTFSYQTVKDESPFNNLTTIMVQHQGINSFNAYFASGYMFGIRDVDEEGYTVFTGFKQFFPGEGEEYTSFEVAPLSNEPGTFSDILYIVATGESGMVQFAFQVNFSVTVTDGQSGQDTTVVNHYFYVDESPYLYIFDYIQGDNYSYHGISMSFENPGEVSISLANGEHMRLMKTENGYQSTQIYYGEDEMMYTQSQWFYIKPLTDQVGTFLDTIIIQPGYGIRAFRIPVTFTVEEAPKYFQLQNSTATITKNTTTEYVDYLYNEAYVENVDSVRYWLADGSAFKIYKMYDIERETPDSLRYVTENVHYQSYFSNYSWWYFWTVLQTNVAGSYVDTLYYQPYGMDSIYHMVLYGSVQDYANRDAYWQDGDVTIHLKGDSLLVYGSGSMSDYGYDYTYGTYRGYPQWYYDMQRNLGYGNYPKHFLAMPGVGRLGNAAFGQLGFTTAEIHADSVGYQVFQYQNAFDTIILGEEIRYVDCDALSNSVNTVIDNMRPDVEASCVKAFNGLNPSKVVANTMHLLTISNPTRVPVEPANDSIRDIYVNYGYYYYMPETGYDLVVTDYLTLDTFIMAGLPARPSMLLDYDLFTDTANTAHVNTPIDANIALGKFVKKDFIGNTSQYYTFRMEVEEGWGYFDPFYTSTMTTLINDGMMTADTVILREKMVGGMWTFMGLPFNQKVSDIACPDNSLMCIRRFNAASQAAGDVMDVWEDVEENDTLHAGEAFIIQMFVPNGGMKEVTFTAMQDDKMQGIFNPSDRSLALAQHPSEDAWNANWNLLVNPYPSFYDTRKIGKEGIITVFSSHSGRMVYYQSFSILDDYYVLQPHEAFFYQAAVGEASLHMPLEGRQHTARAEGKEYVDPWAQYEEKDSVIYEDGGMMSPERSTRTLLNFYLEQNNSKDRARVVLNEAAQMGYEVGRDAMKMMAPETEAAQFFAEQDGAQLSILERPLANGIVTMGATIMTAGDCTISLPDTKGLDVTLYDTQTGAMTNLSLSDYTFYGTPGTYNGRFIIGLVGGTTAIENFIANGGEDGVKKIIENGHVFILRGSDKFDVLGKKQ
ncbi:MAG: hypothetical protein IKN59_00585 [Paludibacteraceae bacterium]|nr:hypothetical protein [Paludibacteraceae bacterium]